jgi:hypothetical protein
MAANPDKSSETQHESLLPDTTIASATAASKMNQDVFANALESLQILKARFVQGKDTISRANLFEATQAPNPLDRKAATFALQHFSTLSGIDYQRFDGTNGPGTTGEWNGEGIGAGNRAAKRDVNNGGEPISKSDVDFPVDMMSGNTQAYVAQSVKRDLIETVAGAAAGMAGGSAGGYLAMDAAEAGSEVLLGAGAALAAGGAVVLAAAGWTAYDAVHESDRWSTIAKKVQSDLTT